MIHRYGKLVGGTLLVSGTTIGAGMLALPVETGMAGFFPSLALLFCYWAYMAFTAFLVLEANLWMTPDTNLVSMARNTLGRWGAIVSWVTYLFLLYSLTTAYISGSGSIIAGLIHSTTGFSPPEWSGALPLVALFSFFVYKGVQSVDYANRLFMGGLAITYVLIIIFLTPHVEKDLLMHSDWRFLSVAVSLVAVSFGFHIIIPTLRRYLEGDIKLLRRSIFIGSLLPLIVYVVWNFLTLGIIPLEGEHGIIQGFHEGQNGANLLASVLGTSNGNISMIARLFSLFAIITSFLGVTISLRDFLADGIGIKKDEKGRIELDALTFIPPVIFMFFGKRVFLTALEYAGAFGVVILLGLLPALMVWSGRYCKGFHSTYKTPGGKLALILAMAFSVLVILLEIANKFGWIDAWLHIQ